MWTKYNWNCIIKKIETREPYFLPVMLIYRVQLPDWSAGVEGDEPGDGPGQQDEPEEEWRHHQHQQPGQPHPDPPPGVYIFKNNYINPPNSRGV